MSSAPWKTLLALLPALALANAAVGAEAAKAKDAPKAKEEAPAKETAKAREEAEPAFAITPILRFIDVDGDAAKFREDWWMRQGFAGGIEEFWLEETVGKDTKFTVLGRGIYDEEDYTVRLELVKPDLGFVRAGFTQYRKYFDDTGGHHPFFSTPSFSLQQDLFLDVGNWFIEAGLTKPNWPKITLGYENQFKEGDKSTLAWGPVSQVPGSQAKRIFPSLKNLDERVDIFKVDIDHTIGKVHMVDQFRYENYRNDTERVDGAQRILSTGGSKYIRVHEEMDDEQFSNAYYVESHVHDKVYVSGGYLFSNVNGEGDMGFDTVSNGVAPFFDRNWHTRNISLDRDSHVLNANILVGPFAGFMFNGGVQAEQTDTDGRVDAILQEILPPAASPNYLAVMSNDRTSLQKNAGVRFTKIPNTVVFADGRWTGESIDVVGRAFENGGLESDRAFLRQTDVDVDRTDYVAGFNTSPIQRANLSAQYRNSRRENGYDHEIDQRTFGGVLGFQEGYPAFITGQEFQTDEVTAKLTVRPINRVSVSFRYQLVATDFNTETDPVPSLGIPAGEAHSGNYRAHIYSVSATVNPINRLYLTGYFSLTDSRTETFDNHSDAVIPFEGDVYTIMATAGYALDEKTDVSLDYLFSRACNFEENNASAAFGLPYGVDNTRRAFYAGIKRQISKNVVARLRYGYFHYDEPTNGNIDDYVAHMAIATCTIRF
jgi:hypothetical protein